MGLLIPPRLSRWMNIRSSGKLLLRIPKELHKELAKAVKDNGVIRII